MEDTPRCESLYVCVKSPFSAKFEAPTPPAQVRDINPNSTPAPIYIFNMMCGGTVVQLIVLKRFHDVQGYGVSYFGPYR